MNSLKPLFIVVVFFLSIDTRALVWPNDPFYLPADSTIGGPVDLVRASFVQSQLQNIYKNEIYPQPLEPKQLPVVLTIAVDWVNPYFAAFATLNQADLLSFHDARVTVWGGYVRVPEMTDAALAATLCHELGHHLGGPPRQQAPLPEWSSSEGQADFYAATVCLPRWFQVATDAQKPKRFHPDILKKCGDSEMCRLVLQAGYEFVTVIHRYSYQNLPSLSLTVSDTLIVPQTLIGSYPSYQCRLDTFIMAAEDLALNKIPRRPACWFRN